MHHPKLHCSEDQSRRKKVATAGETVLWLISILLASLFPPVQEMYSNELVRMMDERKKEEKEYREREIQEERQVLIAVVHATFYSFM